MENQNYNVKNDFRESLKGAVREVLEERTHVDVQTHHAHHDFLAQFIRDEAERNKRAKVNRARFEALLRHVLGWSLVAALGAAANWIAGHLSF